MSKKVAVVTGGSYGIGLAICKKLSKEGYAVYSLSRSKGKIREEAVHIPCDITQEEGMKACFEEILKKEGRLDLVVANAGMGISGAVEFTDLDEARKQFEVNFFGGFLTMKKAGAIMREARCGKIVVISSLGGIFPLPFQGFYSASKAALNALTSAMRLELAPYGVQLSYVMLNDVKTEFTDRREKSFAGDEIYEGRIGRSVSKMEESERNGLSPNVVAREVYRLSRKKLMSPLLIVGAGNKALGILNRILPTRMALWIIGRMYG